MATAHEAYHSCWNKLRTHAVLLNVSDIQCLPMLRENTTRIANKMSPKNVKDKSKQRICVTTATLYYLSLSKAIVSAKRGTCTSRQREMRSRVRRLLILGSSTQKLFNNNSVNIPLLEQVCPIFLFN